MERGYTGGEGEPPGGGGGVGLGVFLVVGVGALLSRTGRQVSRVTANLYYWEAGGRSASCN